MKAQIGKKTLVWNNSRFTYTNKAEKKRIIERGFPSLYLTRRVITNVVILALSL